jgi:malate dehydrogenase (oxaloacetate-decarboxylating)(NADP+)
MRQRRGVMPAMARERMLQRDYYGSMMVHAGDADMLVAGITAHYAQSLRTILEVIGPGPGVRRVSSHYLVLLPKQAVVLADCAVNIEPSTEELAEIALLAATSARSLGIDPRVAMLSFSNFGSVDHPFTVKVRRAAEMARQRAPSLAIDGEMQMLTALDDSLRRDYFPFSELTGSANVLVFPDLQSGNLALHLLQHVGAATVVGPILTGTRLPVLLMQYGITAEEVVNAITVGVVESATR